MRTLLAAFALPTALVFAAPAQADSLVVECLSSIPPGDGFDRVICETPGVTEFKSDGRGIDYRVKIRAPSTHCSEIEYTVAVETSPDVWRTTTLGRLAPGEATEAGLGDDLDEGPRRLEFYGVGILGGCNTGVVHSWGIEYSIYKN